MMDTMKNSWLILLCGGYWLLFWVGRRRNSAKTLLCLWDGFYIGLLTFAVLPPAMETPLFYMAAGSSLLGVLLGFWMEKRGKTLLLLLCLTGVTAVYFLHDASLAGGVAFVVAFFGGMGLYFLTLSRIVLAVSNTVLRAVRQLVHLFLQILFTPFYLLYLPFRRPLFKIRTFCGKQRKKCLHSLRVYVKMKQTRIKRDRKLLRQKKE